jgi:hypothetical protein
METTGIVQAKETGANPAAANEVATAALPAVMVEAVCPPTEVRSSKALAIGYGMPCAKCRAYYPSDMATCPICNSKDRISPTDPAQTEPAAIRPAAEEAKSLVEERERLRELKSQIYVPQAPPVASTMRCALGQNHHGHTEPAAICHECYSAARQESDRLEAALHMDYKEAAQIVYEAVWADSSDPSKTYYNAAHALLVELRKRAGISPGFNLMNRSLAKDGAAKDGSTNPGSTKDGSTKSGSNPGSINPLAH